MTAGEGSYEGAERGVWFLLSRKKKHWGKDRVDK